MTLARPIPGAPFSLAVDASDYAMGAVLQQHANDEWQPLGFATKSLTPAERKYSAYDRELLAMYTAVKRFRHAVEGKNFTIYTDKPLTYAFNQNLEKCSPRQFRYLDYIGQFTTNIRYIEGLDNTLSRVEAIGKSVDHRTLAAAQENDTELRRIVNSATRALRLKKIRFPDQDEEIYCDTMYLIRYTSFLIQGYAPRRNDAFRLAVDKQGLSKLDTAMYPVPAM